MIDSELVNLIPEIVESVKEPSNAITVLHGYDFKTESNSPHFELKTGESKLKVSDLRDDELDALVANMNELVQDVEEVAIDDMRHKLLNWIEESTLPNTIHSNLPMLVANTLSTKAPVIKNFEEIFTFHPIIADFLHKSHLGKTLRTFIAETTPILSNYARWTSLKCRLMATANGQNTLDKEDLQSLCSAIPIHKQVTNVQELNRLYKKYPETSLLKLLFMVYDTAAEYLEEEVVSFASFKEDATNIMKSIDLKIKAISYLYRHFKSNYCDSFETNHIGNPKLLSDFVELFSKLDKYEIVNLENFAKFMDSMGLSKQDKQNVLVEINKIKESDQFSKTEENKSVDCGSCKLCGAKKVIGSSLVRSRSEPTLIFAFEKKSVSHIFAADNTVASGTKDSQLVHKFRKKVDAYTQIDEALQMPKMRQSVTKATNTEPTYLWNNDFKGITNTEFSKIQENLPNFTENLSYRDPKNLMPPFDQGDNTDQVESTRQYLETNLAKSNIEYNIMKARLTKRLQQLTEQLAEMKRVQGEYSDRQPHKTSHSSCQRRTPELLGPIKAARDFEKTRLQLENLKEKFAELSAEYEHSVKSRVLRSCNLQDSRI